MNKKHTSRNVLDRLKKELNLKYDKELAKKLGVGENNLRTNKSRGHLTGTVWDAVISLCHERDIDLHYITTGDSAPGKKRKQIITEVKRDKQENKDFHDPNKDISEQLLQSAIRLIQESIKYHQAV